MLLILLYAETIPFYHGQTIHLPCNSSRHNIYVDWDYIGSGNDRKQRIYVNGAVDEIFERYSVQYPLVISNAIESDAGSYLCTDNAGLGDAVAVYHLEYKGTALCHSHTLCSKKLDHRTHGGNFVKS